MFLRDLYRSTRVDDGCAGLHARSSSLFSLSHRISSVLLLLLLLLLPQVPSDGNALQIGGGSSSLVQPTFTQSMDGATVKENTPIGQQIYRLQARLQADAPKGSRILYGIQGTRLFEVDKFNGIVKVAQQIDREQIASDSLTFYVSATSFSGDSNSPNQYSQATNLSITVYILDENDNAPKITRIKALNQVDYDAQQLHRYMSRNPLIRVNVSEGTPVGSVIVDVIEAQDADKVSSTDSLKAYCLNCEPEFRLELAADRSTLIDGLNASLMLDSPLVHSPRNNLRQLTIVIGDGKYNTSVMIEVTIENVQNKPPQFLGSSTCIVPENVPIDTTIMTLQAIDGDAIAPDDIASSLMRESGRLRGGREVLYDLLPLEDGGGLQVSDVSSFFKLHPLTGELQVRHRLDREAYLLGMSDMLTLRVRARELAVQADSLVNLDETHERMLAKLEPYTDGSLNGQAEMMLSVILVDVNDNTPHWLNSSEIAALNMDQSVDWYKSLPQDRDAGRHYRLQMRENSPRGTPITIRNEMFVYDLDTGDNANFEISLRDEFGLFDVEPKRVSGFAMVNLKYLPQNPSRPLLDYENLNQRRFIIQLVATETNTSERRNSTAQVQIDVLDVNDNEPVFRESSYSANVREDAQPGQIILKVNATDRDEVGRNLSYSLHGVAAHLFEIDAAGTIKLARCEPSEPGSQCIDYERQRAHHLLVEASDGELSSKVSLTVYIEDASDNAPHFKLPVLDVVIEEGSSRLDPPIKIEATDVDQSSVLSYSIVEGNFEGLFSIDNSTGEIQLTRAIQISHDESASPSELLTDADGGFLRTPAQQQQPMNKMSLIVQATDGQRSANGTIRIDVLDANDNSPKFYKPHYSAEINELAAPGQEFLKVGASDEDRGNNARISYKILRGSYGQFEIGESTGVIQVARRFDGSRRSNYTLEVVAQDHGLVSRSTSVKVHIHVQETLKQPPEFSPKIQRVNVKENSPNNTVVHRMQVHADGEELQYQDKLIFEPGPIEALDKNGQPVNESERLEQMFSVSDRSGDILIHSGLDHDFAAYINLTVYVSLRQMQPMAARGYGSMTSGIVNATIMASASTQEQQDSGGAAVYSPKSVGYVIINVLDYNDKAPIFAPPWSPQSPELSFQMLEELPVGSVLAHLTASDADSKISHFKIDPPNEYFELTSPQSGQLVNKKLIDYDALMSQTFRLPSAAFRILTPNGSQTSAATTVASSASGSANLIAPVVNNNNIIQFNVLVFDSGTPQLWSKATVSVEILPVNDWDCKFEQQLYEVRIKENSRPDTVLLQVRAQDLDYGDQHSSIRYQLIGEHSDLFNMDPKTGLISVSSRGSVELDRERLSRPSFSMTVIGKDEQLLATQAAPKNSAKQSHQQQTHRTCSATIRVQVEDVNDNPPLFSQQLYEVTAYDTDLPRVPLVDLVVRDIDQQQQQQHQGATAAATAAARPINTFKIISGNVNDIFSVSSAGVVYATKLLNESLHYPLSEPIQLRIQVRQVSSASLAGGGSGVGSIGSLLPAFTDECSVRIKYVQINRSGPEWRLDSSRPMVVRENSEPGVEVAQLRCYDRDHDPKAAAGSRSMMDNQQQTPRQQLASPIRYWIKENGVSVSETREFKLDPVSGRLITRRELDRESEEVYQLIVACEDNGKPHSLENVIPIYIRVLDLDDNKPEFVASGLQQQELTPQLVVGGGGSSAKSSIAAKQISFSIEERQSKGLPVGELRAIDRDLEGINPNPIHYCLLEGNENQDFLLDRLTGQLYTNQSLDREKQSSYELLVEAINDGSTCESRDAANLTGSSAQSLLWVKIEVLDINDNAPLFRRPLHRAGVHHRALMNTLVTQVAALDPDSGVNGSLIYKISEILMYKTSIPSSVGPNQQLRGRYEIERSEPPPLSKPIKLIQFPFRIDQQGNIYTQQLLTQYHLMSMFVLQIEASEVAEPWRTASARLEVYLYETSNQLKIRLNLHPRLVEAHRSDIEALLSNATKYTAIINRARSYYGSGSEPPISAVINQQVPKSSSSSRQDSSTIMINREIQLQQGNSISSLYDRDDHQQPSSTNIHLIFVDNHRIVNPSLVMEKIDLTSAELFTPKSLISQLQQSTSSSSSSSANNNQQSMTKANIQQQQEDELRLAASDMSSLIDKVALASAVQSAEYLSSGGSLLAASINWLENPAILIVTLTAILALVGFIACLFGCCCTSRIKDHIVKVAMDKLVKQQAMQAKINEQVLAATSQSVLAAGGGHQNILSGQSPNGAADYLLQQGGFISAFDATKGCISNNNENMSILQRAMQDASGGGGEFIDPNYTTLNWQANIGAHYYDTSELDEGGPFGGDPNGNLVVTANGKQFEESRASVSLGEEDYDDDVGDDARDLNSQLAAHVVANNSNMVSSKVSNGGMNSIANNNHHQRQRQQVPSLNNK